jgi:hypothetical protein
MYCDIVPFYLLLGGMPSGWLLAMTLAVQTGGFSIIPFCNSVMMLIVVYSGVSFLFNSKIWLFYFLFFLGFLGIHVRLLIIMLLALCDERV